MDIVRKFSEIICLVLFIYLNMFVETAAESKEYCQVDTFKPKCSEDQVVIITHGSYGRMKTGRCLKIDNNLGCSADVLDKLTPKCSGQKTCSVEVVDLSREIQLPCLQEMSPYLEVDFKCQNVLTPDVAHCLSPLLIETTSRSNFLSSAISSESKCGLHQTPYILEAKPGQKIQLSIHDFSVTNPQSESCVINYGYIMDTSNDDVINLCGGQPNKQILYTSLGKTVHVLLEKQSVESYHFLIEYKAIGCPDITPPKHAWLQRTNTTVIIGCQTSDDKWTMKCIGNIWLGIMRNCTAPLPVLTTTQEIKQLEDTDNSGIPLVTDNHLFAIGIGCVTIIVCVTTIMLGIHCVKRYELSTEKKNSFNMNTLNQSTIYRPVNIAGGTLQPFNTNTGLPAYTLDRGDNPPELPRRTSSMMEPTTDNIGSVDYFNLVNVQGSQTGRDHNEKIYHSIHRQEPLLG